MKLTPDVICARLIEHFGPDVSVEDDSHKHVGHPGAQGGGHYTVRIRSARFSGLSTLSCHRLVYDAVAEWMPHAIHALAIHVTPSASSLT
ncbi:MAG: BolA family protein [Burkholderiaceae bacterium]